STAPQVLPAKSAARAECRGVRRPGEELLGTSLSADRPASHGRWIALAHRAGFFCPLRPPSLRPSPSAPASRSGSRSWTAPCCTFEDNSSDSGGGNSDGRSFLLARRQLDPAPGRDDRREPPPDR